MKSLNASRIFAPALLASAISMAAGAADFSNVDTNTTPGGMLGEISPTQFARAQAKLTHAMQIADHFAPSAADSALPDRWRFELVNALMQKPEAGFAQVEAAGTARDALQLAAAGAAAGAPSQAKALGDVGDDLTYVPLASPCRIADTRSGGGSLAPFTPRTLNFTNSNAGQGGSGCTPFAGYVGGGVPGAAAVNITVIGGGAAAAGSYLQAYAAGGSTTTSWLNFGAGQIIANQGVLPISTGYQFVLNASAQVDAIVDVFGSFVRPAATPLNCVVVGVSAGSTSTELISLPASSNNYYNTTSCPAGYTVTTPYCWSQNAAGVYANGSGVTGGGNGLGGAAFCSFINLNGSAAGAYVGTTCCRIPGR